MDRTMQKEIPHCFKITQFYRLHYLELSADYYKPSIPYEGLSVTFVDKGSIVVSLNNKPVTVEAAHGFFMKPHCDNSMKTLPGKSANVYIVVFELEDAAIDMFTDKIFPITGTIYGYLKIMLKEAKYAYLNDLRVYDYPKLITNEAAPYGAEQILRSYTELLLIEVVRLHYGTTRPDYMDLIRETLIMQNIDINPLFAQILDYLDANIDRQLTLDQISHDNHISASQVQKLFQKCTNEGVLAFHQKIKIEKAKALIRETSLTFTEISGMLGFSSVHYFSKKFKDLVHMSPSAYQRFVR